jgi:hypothetical protein
MRTTIKSLIILLIIIHFSIYTNAGNNFPPIDSSRNIHNPTLAFSLHPLYTLQNGFRVDFEIHIIKNQWLIIGPQYFIAENKSMNTFFLAGVDRTMDMEGYGVDIYHKIILKTEESIIGPYAAYGIRYNSFNFKADAENGNTKMDVTNTRYGFNVLFGYQNVINDKLLIDVYTGCGLQVSNLSGDDGTFADKSNFFMNYNYSGPRFLLGFRIGLFLN